MAEAEDAQARTVVRALLNGEPPPTNPLEGVGEWAEIVQGLVDAWATGGADAVHSTWQAYRHTWPGVGVLLASEPSDLPGQEKQRTSYGIADLWGEEVLMAEQEDAQARTMLWQVGCCQPYKQARSKDRERYQVVV